MLKKIFIYLLFFTFYLESIDGKNITLTKDVGRAIVVWDFEEQSNGNLICEKETEYVFVEHDGDEMKMRKYYIGKYGGGK